jgi:nucleoid-associated protein YgaU
MRALLLLLVLAGAFALAAVWQRKHVAELRAARDAAEAAQAPSPDPLAPELAAGEAVLIVGRPSGAEPRPRPTEPVPQKPRPSESEPTLSDFSQEVQSGQTLSGIAHVHYGQSGPALVRALAHYNGLSDPDQLRAGQTLRLPPIEKLQTAAH